MGNMTRRDFTRTSIALGVTTALGSMRVLGANDRVGMALIGCGGRGSQVADRFLKMADAAVVAVADVYVPFRERALSAVKAGTFTNAAATAGGSGAGAGASSAAANASVIGVKDFRQVLDRKDVDAVIIATPDHWHALMAVAALRAGKDVYVEKPLSLVLREGRLIADEAKRTSRICAVGSQQRSGGHYAEAVQLIREGGIGSVHHVQAGMTRNAMPGFVARELRGGLTDALDWDMWLGPAPKVPFDPFRAIYHFRWFWDYSGGQMTNWGAHHLDIARWALGAKAPKAVAGFGGRYAIKDGGETPDVQQVLYQFVAEPSSTAQPTSHAAPTSVGASKTDNCVVTWSTREVNAGEGAGLVFHGTKGTLDLARSGYTIRPETWTGDDPSGAPRKREPAIAAREVKGTNLDEQHVRNFLDCVKSRQRPNADAEEGHLSAVMCHLGNLSTRLGRSLTWDAARERVKDDDEANALLTKGYRRPWTLEGL
jgi:predicted dehydrogenase